MKRAEDASTATERTTSPITHEMTHVRMDLHVVQTSRRKDVRLTTLRSFIELDHWWVTMHAYRAQTGENGISLPDPVAMAVALAPSIVGEASTHRVRIECSSDLTRGMTVVDRLNVANDERNRSQWQSHGKQGVLSRVVWSIDVGAFKRMLFDRFR